MFTFLLLSLFLFSTVCTEGTVEQEDDVVNDETQVDVTPDEDQDEDDDDEEDDGSPEPDVGQKISFSQPSLSEEEQKSYHFPDRYRCDACQIITHNLGSDFNKAESKLPKKTKKRTLGDVEVVEIVEEVCSKDKFKDYSIQDFGGKVTFKGPAFPDRKEAGMSMGGGLWPIRYTNYCGSVFEDIEESEAYEAYRQGSLFKLLCLERDCKGVIDHTPDILNIRPGRRQQGTLTREEL